MRESPNGKVSMLIVNTDINFSVFFGCVLGSVILNSDDAARYTYTHCAGAAGSAGTDRGD